MTGPEDAATQQVRAVAARVGSGPYAHEVAEVQAAAAAVPRLVDALSLSGFANRLSHTGKPQVVLRFDDPARGSVVLKVLGRRTAHEVSALEVWGASGIRVPAVLDFGDEPVSWMLLAYVANEDADSRSIDVTTGQLAEVMRRAHAVPVNTVRDAVPLAQALPVHLGAVVAALEHDGRRSGGDWQDWVPAVWSSGTRAVLHGDLAPGNVRDDGHGLVLLDPATYLGDPTFDMVRWVVRTAAPNGYADAIAAWTAQEPVDPSLVEPMLATEVLMQAGVQRLREEESGTTDEAARARNNALVADMLQVVEDLRPRSF